MNERFKELAEKAGMYIVDDKFSTYGKFAEKFATLIVEECAKVARSTPCPNFQENLKQQLGHTWDMASVEAGNEIMKHFGVEK